MISTQSLNNIIDNIKFLGFGSYSTVSQIGNYILKLGKNRENKEIPNDKRILQPLLRRSISSGTETIGENICNYIEVQDFVDAKWYTKFTINQINEELYRIYADMRNRGIIWNDIKK